MNAEKQLELWVEGKSVHDDEQDWCCPDFSCCQPDFLAPEHERRIFLEAYQRGNNIVMDSMLAEFLGRAISSQKVYVAGYRENRRRSE